MTTIKTLHATGLASLPSTQGLRTLRMAATNSMRAAVDTSDFGTRAHLTPVCPCPCFLSKTATAGAGKRRVSRREGGVTPGRREENTRGSYSRGKSAWAMGARAMPWVRRRVAPLLSPHRAGPLQHGPRPPCPSVAPGCRRTYAQHYPYPGSPYPARFYPYRVLRMRMP